MPLWGAMPYRFLHSLHPHLHLLLGEVPLVRCCLELLKATEGSWDFLEHLVRVVLGLEQQRVVQMLQAAVTDA